MNIGNINNTGDGNYFHQSVGEVSLYSLDLDGLVCEYMHVKGVISKKRKARLLLAVNLLVIGAVFASITVVLLMHGGYIADPWKLINFVDDLTTGFICAVFSALVGVVFAALGVDHLMKPTNAELRNIKRQNRIREIVEDKGISAKEWKRAIKRKGSDQYPNG